MSISEYTEQSSVKVTCKDASGSGCFIKSKSDEYDYIITALHCLKGKGPNFQSYNVDDIKINYRGSIIDVIDEHPHRNLDLVVLKIRKTSRLYATYIAEPHIGDNIVISGYPHVLDKQHVPVVSVDGKINNKTEDICIVKVNDELSTYNAAAIRQIEGLSGSGVFTTRGDKIALVGMLIKLTTSDFAYRQVDTIHVDKVLEIIAACSLSDVDHLYNPNDSEFAPSDQVEENIDPIYKEWYKINADKERNIQQKIIDVCNNFNPKRFNIMARKIASSEAELGRIDKRISTAFMHRIFYAANEVQCDLVNSSNGQLSESEINQWLSEFYKAARILIDDKSKDYDYILKNDDIIRSTVLKLIDDCYLSFDEKGLL